MHSPENGPAFDKVGTLFEQARALPEREALEMLGRACGDNPQLLSEVLSLLEAHRCARDFLEQPVAPPPAMVEPSAPTPDADGRCADSLPQSASLGRYSADHARPRAVAMPTIAGYRFERELGEGGFGVVYLAEQLRPIRRRVAIKVVRPGPVSSSLLNRFDGERQALALLDHPGIAKVYDAGSTDSGLPYFVMEYVEGSVITKHCEAHSVEVPGRLELVIQVCEAVAHAHRRRIIHRDIKPGNVLVATIDGRPQAKLIDLGIAKAMGFALTEQPMQTLSHQVLGTPQYMSPEQSLGVGAAVDERTDVYSIGVMLYELLTAGKPYDLEGQSFTEIQRIIREADPLPFSRWLLPRSSATRTSAGRLTATFSRRLKPELEWIVRRALEKEPARRYAGATELAEDLRRYLRREPVLAGPPGPAYRTRKFFQRYRAPVAVITTVALILGAAGAGVMVSFARAAAARKDSRWTKYCSEMSAALSGLAANDPTAARTAIESVPQEFRGWEWRYVMRESQGWDASFATEHVIFSLAAHDADLIAAGAARGSILLFEAGLDAPPVELHGHTSAVNALAFSPDGLELFSASSDGSVRCWSGTHFAQSRMVYESPGAITSIAFSPDRRTIAICRVDEGIVVLEDGPGKETRVLPAGHGKPSAVAFGPRGSGTLLLGTADGWIEWWDAQMWTQIAAQQKTEKRIRSIAVHPTLPVFIAGDMGGGVTISEGGPMGELKRLPAHRQAVKQVAFSSKGDCWVSSSNDKTISIWKYPESRSSATLHGHTAFVDCFALIGDGPMVVSGSWDLSLRSWTKHLRPEYARVGSDGICAMSGGLLYFSPDRRTLASAPIGSGAVRTADFELTPGITAIAGDCRSRRLAVGTTSGEVLSLDGPESAPVTIGKLTGSIVRVDCAAGIVAAGAIDGDLGVWNTGNIGQSWTAHRHNAVVTSVELSRTGNLAVFGLADGTLLIRAPGRSSGLLSLSVAKSSVVATAIDPGAAESWVAAAASPNLLRVFATRSGALTATLLLPAEPTSSLAAAGSRLFVGCGDGSLVIVDTDTWSIVCRIPVFDRNCARVFFDESDEGVIVVCADGRVRKLATGQPFPALNEK